MHQGAIEFSMFIVVSGSADVYVIDTKNEDAQMQRERISKPVPWPLR